jgi:2-dehydro-3-deoxyphosphogluconate aldolase / (4S)-4-hydroxy-2-oxoglutarate aldolase
MNKKQQAVDAVIKQGLLPLYFHADADVCVNVLKTLYNSGVRTIEFTNRGEEAFANFNILLQERNQSMPDMLLGIGTIKNLVDAKKFVEAGADYIISPGFSVEVATYVHEQEMLYIPGTATATEIMAAEAAGCNFVKIFPGNILGPAFMNGIREIFPDLYFMPTGGVDVDTDNIRKWFDAGVKAVGLGSKLISKSIMDQQDYTTLAILTRKAIDIVNEVR